MSEIDLKQFFLDQVRLFEHFPRDRTALAQHQFLIGKRCQRGAATLGQGMTRRREQHEAVRAQAYRVQSRIRNALRHDGDVHVASHDAPPICRALARRGHA